MAVKNTSVFFFKQKCLPLTSQNCDDGPFPPEKTAAKPTREQSCQLGMKVIVIDHEVNQGVIKLPIFWGIKHAANFMVNLREFPLYKRIVWVGNTMTPVN